MPTGVKRGWSGWRAIVSVCLVLAAATIAQGARAQVERLVGGHEARPGKWPYQAVVDINDGSSASFCGGTLVAPRWVLTAGHCAVNTRTGAVRSPAMFSVRLGSVDRRGGGELHRVVRVVPHESFDSRTLHNDIALLELDGPSAMTLVGLESLPARSRQRSIKADASPWATVIGWGLVDPVSGKVADILQEASLPLVDAERCNRSLSPRLARYGPIDERRLCAGLSEGGIDACNGDSGGPLLIADGEGGWVQVGLVSYGEPACGKAETYGIYTRVAAFSDWVARAMGGQGAPAAAGPAPLALGATSSAPTMMANAAEEKGVVRIAMSRRDLRVGDGFELAVFADFDGYLALFDQNERNEITQLFPNPRSAVANKDGSIRRGAPMRLPDSSYGFAFEAGEPLGRGRILALVVSDRRALRGIGAEDGFRALADPSARFAELERLLASPEARGQGGAPFKWGAAFVDYLVR